MFLKISQNSQENTCSRVSIFDKLAGCWQLHLKLVVELQTVELQMLLGNFGELIYWLKRPWNIESLVVIYHVAQKLKFGHIY